MQRSSLQSIQAASVEIFHHQMLLGEGRTSKVEARQKKTGLTGHANKDFHKKSFGFNLTTESIDLEPEAGLV